MPAETPPADGDLRDRLVAAFSRDPHFSIGEYADTAVAVLIEMGGELYDRIVNALAEQVPADEYSPNSAASVAYNAVLPALANLDIAAKDARQRAEQAEAELADTRVRLEGMSKIRNGQEAMERVHELRATRWRARAERYRLAWQSARERAKASSESVKRLCEQRNLWIETAKGRQARAEQAEAAAAEWQAACEAHQRDGEALMAALERVRARHYADRDSDGKPYCREDDYPMPCPTLRTLGAPSGADSPQSDSTDQQTAQHIGGRANAEDCPACSGGNPPYPWICPGEPDSPPSGRTDVPRHAAPTREAGEAQEAAE